MSYILGVDLGTTSTAAAVNDGDAVRVFIHPSGETAIPSVLALDEAGLFLVGTAAIQHGSLAPEAVAREFKRRFGDSTPLLLRGTPVAANDLTLRLAQSVVETVSGQIGERPDRLVVCHPANWGQFKLSLLSDTLANSSLPPHDLMSEPQAAAVHYAGLERVADQTMVAVYDLGGGTFDVAVLRKDETAPDDTGWMPVGRPGGIERLGGIDFDTAVLSHVLAAADIDLDTLDDTDAATQLSVARLREACSQAKVALSNDSSTTVAISLPGIEETVRITRAEFEAMIGPAVDRTLETLDITLGKAGIRAGDLDRILLVGGSSRIPLIGQRLTAHTGCPISIDAHPKNAIALGAAASRHPGASGSASAEALPDPPAQQGSEPQSGDPSHGHTVVLSGDVLSGDVLSGDVLSGDVLSPTQPPMGTPPRSMDDAEVPTPLGTNFPGVPHMADEPLPEFLARRQGPPTEPAPSESAEPQPMPAETQPIPALGPPAFERDADAPSGEALTQPLPDLRDRQPAPMSDPQVVPQPPPAARRRSPVAMVAAILLLAASAVGGFLIVDRLADTETSTDTTPTTASTSTGPSTTTPTSATTELLGIEGNCPESEQPVPGVAYRVVEISADDPDGGLNGRRQPDVNAEVIRVFTSRSPVKVTGQHCQIDDGGRTWWSARTSGQLVWVAARYLEPLE